MLYDHWLAIAREHRAEIALHELATDRHWTFAELLQAGDVPLDAHGLCHPQGNRADFVIQLLRAWRSNAIVCPLEIGQSPLNLSGFPSNCVHLKTTSASTGEAKLIAFTGEQLAADAENIVATMGLRRDWPNIATISLAHSYGFSNLVLPLLLHGIPLILAESALPDALRRAAVLASKVTLPGVPALWRAWHEAKAIPAHTRVAISAGAPLLLTLEQAVYAETGVKIHNFLGSSECGGIAFDTAPAPRSDATGAGVPMTNVALAIGDDGCLEVRSRAVASTYWPTPDERLANGVFRTTDLAEIKDGQVLLRGRATDLINVAGRKVPPESIERALLAHPQVRECLVFGAPDRAGERSEVIVACVVAEPGASVEDVRQFVMEKLPAWQVPREWRLVESLEVNQRGKLPRAEWRKRYEDGIL